MSSKLKKTLISSFSTWLPLNSSIAPPIRVRNQDVERSPTAHKWAFMGSHCSNIWGACECGGQRAYWWVCLLAPLTFTRLTENVSECQMLALVMMQLLKSLSYWSIASLPSPNSCLLSPCPFPCLFSLSSSRSLLLPCAEQPTPVKDQKSKVWIMDPMHILAETVNIYFYSWVLLVLH